MRPCSSFAGAASFSPSRRREGRVVNRSRVARWTPPFVQALRLALRPALAYLVFCGGGFLALAATFLWYERGDKDLLILMIILGAGFAGILGGLLVSVLRLRALPVFIAGGLLAYGGIWALMVAPIPKELALAFFVFCWAFPCGMLALQHRWELFASFWPAVGWIGAVFVIINNEGRINAWEQEKVTAWLPVPLFFLACFLVLWLFYLAAKQAVRVELWQALSGAVGRRIAKKASVGAIPRRNVLPMLVAAAVLFAFTAVLAPYLWRTGKGDHASKPRPDRVEKPEPEKDRTPKMDGEAIMRQLKQMAEAAKNTAVNLWPLLLLVVLYRPAKRALLRTHLLTPVFPTPPTERIDNNWEYVRIAAEDAGVIPLASDSVEQLLARIAEKGLAGPALANAAAIYARTRYGFVVGRGDAIAMRAQALEAGRELTKNLTTWDRVKSWWRPLA